MLKQSPLIDELCVHDVLSNGGFISELNYVDTNCKVSSFTGRDNLSSALRVLLTVFFNKLHNIL